MPGETTHTTMPSQDAHTAAACQRAETLFYDGTCGLCHFTVRFLLARDVKRQSFRFAPLAGETFRQRVSASQRSLVPDSVVLLTASGELLWRSRAVLYALRKLGGGWSVLAACLAVVPRPLLDLAYSGVARIRRRLFRTPETTCPRVPAALMCRFDP